MPTEPAPVTLSQVVHRAVEVCDPDGNDTDVADFFIRFEEADEPIAGLEEVEKQMAAAVATYLSFRRDEVDEEPEELLRLASRAEFDGQPPPVIASWLEEQGVA